MPARAPKKNLPALRGAGERVLLRLKTRGAARAADISLALGISAEAVRQSLVKLEEEGLVTVTTEPPQGVGRPTQRWSLTAAGHERFPNAHAELTVQLLDSVRTVLGKGALDRLIDARESQMRATYEQALAGAADLNERVARLVELRAREGYMAEYWREDDSFLLVENHCPICVAATVCQGLCRSELHTFRAVLEADVQRVEHIVDGARRCAYRITPGAARSRKIRKKG
ncbi:helix-turn-helix transcriptional regulator [Pendulispora albinea]|uniref:Transcriptional regulator n=1 Tax=Pendulispora albinea TaxID=2741071 RepID=A0ABZ2M280_9BACT